jgi:hypothetical protein
MFTRRLTVIVYFAVVLIPVLLLGHDGPWLSGGDAEIRVKTPFRKSSTPAPSAISTNGSPIGWGCVTR